MRAGMVGLDAVAGATWQDVPLDDAEAAGMFLLSLLDTNTPYWQMALAMLVLGIGIGLAMQVLTIVVQSTVAYEDLGVATSGVTFFRTLGSSFGVPVFGVSAIEISPEDERAHGLDEKVPVESVFRSREYWYELVKSLTQMRR